MDLEFSEGDEVSFSVVGDNSIFITGNIIPEEIPYDLSPDDEVDSAEESADDSNEGSDYEEIESQQSDISDQPDKAPKMKSATLVSPPATPSMEKKQKLELKSSTDGPPPKKQALQSEPKVSSETQDDSSIRKLPSGLIIEDVNKGNGPRAKNGNRVAVRYIGKLTNGKIFDQNTKGKPFSFVLGKSEVIKGWDLGVQGMQVGGTRRLTIPPHLAYGKKGAAPEIPPNATLKFDIKLMDTKGK